MPEDILQDSWPPISTNEIAIFEKHIGMELPKAYSQFLLRRNGGRSADTMLFGEGVVQQLYGLDLPYRWADLRWKFDNFVRGKRMARSCVPVASDPFGNQYVLICDGPHRGSVYFWDHDNEPSLRASESSKFNKMNHVSATFDAFLLELTTKPDECFLTDAAIRAAALGDLTSLEQMINGGLSVDYRADDELDGMTLFAVAVCFGRLNIMRYLHKVGADIGACDSQGEPPIFSTCVGRQSSDALRLLLDWGVSPNCTSLQGKPLIVHAAQRKSGGILTWLLCRTELDLNGADADGVTALDAAKKQKDEDTERLLSGTSRVHSP